jgi:serine/threonine protein phosphatase PrpC
LLDGLKPNKINHRIHELSYPANSPIEDKIVSTQLEGINGYMVSVFDGHGGDLLSSYAAERIT